MWDNYLPLLLYFFKGGMYMKYFIDSDGSLLNTINEDDKVKIVRKETLDFIKSEDDKIEINVDATFIKLSKKNRIHVFKKWSIQSCKH